MRPVGLEVLEESATCVWSSVASREPPGAASSGALCYCPCCAFDGRGVVLFVCQARGDAALEKALARKRALSKLVGVCHAFCAACILVINVVCEASKWRCHWTLAMRLEYAFS